MTSMHLEAEVRESKAQKQAHPRGMIMNATPPNAGPKMGLKDAPKYQRYAIDLSKITRGCCDVTHILQSGTTW